MLFINMCFFLVKARFIPKQAELKELKSKVLELKEQELSNRAIAKLLNCSEFKIRNILKK